MAAFAPTRALGTSGYQLAIHRSHFRFYSFSKTQAGLSRERGAKRPQKSQYQRGSPAGRFLKRFMLHMYWLGYSRT
jgi:hypothetical protein